MKIDASQFERLVAGGANAWNQFILENPPPHTVFGYASEAKVDFSRFQFSDVIFDGCTFKSLKLSDTLFSQCTFRKSLFYNCGVVNARFTRCYFENFKIAEGTLRDVEISDGNGTDIAIADAVVKRLKLQNLSVGEITVERCSTFDANMRGLLEVSICFSSVGTGSIVISDSSLPKFDFDECSFDLIDLSYVRTGTFRNLSSHFKSMDVDNSRIDGFTFHPSGAGNIRLASCQLRKADLNQLDLGSIDLTDCSLIDCVWPEQSGRVTILGRFLPPENPLKHPVHDIKGISNQIRSTISATQFICSMQERSASSYFQSTKMRLWGASTSFGLSPFRFFMFGLTFILTLSLMEASALYWLEVLNRCFLGTWDELSLWWLKSTEIVRQNFIFSFGFGEISKLSSYGVQKFALWALAAFRLFFLALMISLLANYVTRTLNH